VNDPDNVVDPVVLAERRARRAELAESELRELLRETELGAATLKGRLSAVEAELATARAQRDALAADLARRENELIAASQREHAETALRSEAQTRAAEASTGSRRELDDLRVRLVAAEQRAALLTQVEVEVADRLAKAVAAEKEMVTLRAEVAARQAEVLGLRHELERYAQVALRMPAEPGPPDEELARRIAVERSAFAAQVAAVERTVAQMRPQLAAAVSELTERMAFERAAREAAEAELAAERGKVAELQARLEAATRREAAVLEVVAELSASVAALRERFAGELDERVAELTGAAEALRAELGREQAHHSAALAELEREQAKHSAALSELDREQAERVAAQSELEREQAERAAAQSELEREQAERVAAVSELERQQAESAAAQLELEREQAERVAALSELERAQTERAGVQSELEREQVQHAAAQSELAREQGRHAATQAEVDRQESHREAIRSELAQEQARRAQAQAELERERAQAQADLERERRRLAEVSSELEALRAAPPPAPTIDIEEFTRAAERLRAEIESPLEEAPAEQVAEPELDPAPVPETPRRREELAEILAAQQAAAAAARAPAQDTSLPVFPVPAVVPVEDADPTWLREGIRRVGRGDPALAAEILLALAPSQAQASRRDVAYQLTIPDTGTWRVMLRDGEASIEPGTTAGGTDFGVSGAPGDVAALLAGGGRRRVTARVEGSRVRLWRLARDRRVTPTLAQATAAGGRFPLRGVLALAASVAPDGDRTSVTFDSGTEQITAVGTRGGAVVLRTSREKSAATLQAPAADLVALLIGLAPEGTVRVIGDAEQAAALVARLHRAQGLR
jgi:hypothetical protein